MAISVLRRLRDVAPVGAPGSRERRAVLSAAASAAAKIIQALTVLVTVPLLLAALGPEQYGIWITLSSIATLIGFADLGLASGVVTHLARADGAGNFRSARSTVSNSAALLVGIAVVLAAVYAATEPHVGWAALVGASSPAAGEVLVPSIRVFVGFALLGIPLGLALRVHAGLQESFVASIWTAVGSAAALCALVALARGGATLPWLVAGAAGTPVVVLVAATAALFASKPLLRPRWTDLSRAQAAALARSGAAFFVLQLLSVVIWSSDYVLVARMFGAEAVTRYAVPGRIFSFAGQISAMMLAPLWPAYAEALARGDREWAIRTFQRTLLYALGWGVLTSVGLALAAPWLLRSWVDPQWVSDPWLLAAFAVQSILSAVSVPMYFFLNGAGALRFQVAVTFALAAMVIPARIGLSQAVGLVGVPLATGVTHLAFWVVPVGIFVARRILPELRGGAPRAAPAPVATPPP